jgi:hypothetical protein
MIKLSKGCAPEILTRLAATWTQALLERLGRGETPTDTEKGRYRHPEVKAALIEETHGKCAYCESKLRHITHGDIDHIVPKSVAHEKTFEWENLTLACDVCNENKSSHFGHHEDLVDPYTVDPNDHFLFVGPVVLPVPGSDPGLLTERILKLNRAELIERRQEKIMNLVTQVSVLARINDPNVRSVVRQSVLETKVDDTQEFAALTRYCISILLEKLDKAEMKQPASIPSV